MSLQVLLEKDQLWTLILRIISQMQPFRRILKNGRLIRRKKLGVLGEVVAANFFYIVGQITSLDIFSCDVLMNRNTVILHL